MSINGELSNLFSHFAALLEVKGQPVFKAIAFQKMSRLLRDGGFDAKEVVESNTLKDIAGVGPSIQRIIEDYVRSGKSADYDEVAASVPPGLIPMLDIPGLGPKTIAMLWKQRSITSIDELTRAIDAGALAGIKGLGEKKIEGIKQGIALRAQASERMGIIHALPIGVALLEELRKVPGVAQAELAGSLRRRKETIGDIDIVCALSPTGSSEEIAAAFVSFPEVARILGQGKTKASILTHEGLQVDLRMVPSTSFGAALQYFTGSKDHNKHLRSLALDKDLTLNEWGLYRHADYDKSAKKTSEAPTAKSVAGATEQEVYKALGLYYIEPTLREDRGEIEAAAAGKLPKLISLADIHGDLHAHTTASDGSSSIEEMIEAARALGYKFLAITDHSKSQVIANGLSAERLLAHVKQIHKIARQYKDITVFAGCEVDILVDGRLDFEDDILAQLDWVVASPHISLKQDADKATARILRAIENRYVNVIGHPTGRIIHGRLGLPLDIPKIVKAAAETGTALEINASYPRLDLNDIHARAALNAGGVLSINTDAHSTEEFAAMTFGIDVAQRAWASAKDVINCWTLARLQTFIAKKRSG